MIIMRLKLSNILGFDDIDFNFSYPKKLTKNIIDSEFIPDIPSFRYKKVNIIFGSNSNGKSSLGKTIWGICLFLRNRTSNSITDLVSDTANQSRILMDFVTKKGSIYILNRVDIQISRTSLDQKQNGFLIQMGYDCVSINKKDTYEKAITRFDNFVFYKDYIKCLEDINSKSGWLISMPITEPGFDSFTYDLGKEKQVEYSEILYKVLSTLDPNVNQVIPSNEIENSFLIQFDDGKKTIVQSGDLISNIKYLSSGSKYAFHIASTLYGIKNHLNGIYYIDELFSYINSDIEIGVLSTMITMLGDLEQLFFTTHNTDVLSLGLPLHSFIFLGKEKKQDRTIIKTLSADEFEKRNNVVVKNLYENDVFGIAPSIDQIYSIEG